MRTSVFYMKALSDFHMVSVRKEDAIDQFTHSVHVEIVCLLSNRKRKPDTYVKLSLDAEDYYRFRDAEDQKNN